MVEFKDRSESIFAVTIAFLIISLAAVSLRCFVRLKLVKAFGWDDGLMLLAMVCIRQSYLMTELPCVVSSYSYYTQAANILFALCGIVGPLYGMGQTFAELDPTNIKTAMFVCILSGPYLSKYRYKRKLT